MSIIYFVSFIALGFLTVYSNVGVFHRQITIKVKNMFWLEIEPVYAYFSQPTFYPGLVYLIFLIPLHPKQLE